MALSEPRIGIADDFVSDFFGIPYDPNPSVDTPVTVSRRDFDLLCVELHAAGIPLKPDREQAWIDYRGWRVNYDVVLVSLCSLWLRLRPNGRATGLLAGE